jgi:hypothetical protein
VNAQQAVGAAAALVTVLTAILRLIHLAEKQRRAFEVTRMLAERSDQTGKLLLKALIAILDGLKQQGCNGKVSEMHETLIRHAVEK